jgi:hypothetical protein
MRFTQQNKFLCGFSIVQSACRVVGPQTEWMPPLGMVAASSSLSGSTD